MTLAQLAFQELQVSLAEKVSKVNVVITVCLADLVLWEKQPMLNGVIVAMMVRRTNSSIWTIVSTVCVLFSR